MPTHTQYSKHISTVLVPIKNQRTTSQKKLSKQNLEVFQDHILSLPQPDSVLEWISLTNASMDPNLVGPVSKKRKLLAAASASIAESGGHKYSTSYTNLLYLLGITFAGSKGIIPSGHEHPEIPEYFPKPNNLPLLSRYMTSWFQKFKPNEASLVHFLRECLFPLKVSTSGENIVTILHEFSGPFKSHDLKELSRGNEEIKFPIIKRDPKQEISETLQTPAEEDLRSRSDFVFAATTSLLGVDVLRGLKIGYDIPGLSNNSPTCAVAIVAEVKAHCLPTSFFAARNQWSSLAYLHMMERVSICREKSYVGDENICQYGYIICGLTIVIWKMGLEWNRSKKRQSEILESYFTFPIKRVGTYDLEIQGELEDFVDTHKKLLQWWINGYLSSYIKDITNIMAEHPFDPARWRTSWQRAVENFNPNSGDNPTIALLDASTLEEQPAIPPVGAETEGETLQQDNPDTHDDGICCGTTRQHTRCRKRVKSGKYCLLHQKA